MVEHAERGTRFDLGGQRVIEAVRVGEGRLIAGDALCPHKTVLFVLRNERPRCGFSERGDHPFKEGAREPGESRDPHQSEVEVEIDVPRRDYLRRTLHAERSVNSSESRGTLSIKGPMAHPRPVGMERVSDTVSICI